MSMVDPISDYLTRIRNAAMARHNKVDIPASKILRAITQILYEEGYILNYTTLEDNKQGILRIYLKYGENKKSVICHPRAEASEFSRVTVLCVCRQYPTRSWRVGCCNFIYPQRSIDR